MSVREGTEACMDKSKLYLGIDYGGDAVKLGLVDAYGQLSGHSSIPTKNLTDNVSCRAFAAEVGDFVHGMGIYSSELGGVGLAIPGIADAESFLTPNVKVDWPLLVKCLEHTFAKQKVAIVNDSNAAALGELWMGAGAHARSLLLVTVGSGIGSGLVIDGNVVSGAHGAAGEVGHITVVPGGRPCKCGRQGCVERYASARGIVQTFKELDESGQFEGAATSSHYPESETDALAVFEAARLGDARALESLAVMADKLGFALAQVACVVDPGLILLGGGLAAGADLYLDDLRAAFKSYCFAACADTRIDCASLLADAGVIGAARFSMKSNPRDNLERDWMDPDFGL